MSIVGGAGGWDGAAGKKFRFPPPLRDGIAHFLFVSPEAYSMCTLPSEDDGNAGAPRSCSDDGDLAHPRLDPMRFSVPVNRRRMFSWCLAMISSETREMSATVRGLFPYSCSIQTRIGKRAIAAIDPKET